MIFLPNGKSISKYEISRQEYKIYISYLKQQQAFTNQKDNCYSPKVYYRNNKKEVSFEVSPGINWENPGFVQNEDEPVVCVSGNDAKNYAKWLSSISGHRYEIPSQEDILYAMGLNSSKKVFWSANEPPCLYSNINDENSNEINQFPWDFARCSDGFPERISNNKISSQTVGINSSNRFKPNKFGIYHLIGNVYEWLSTDCSVAGQIKIWGGSWTSAPDIPSWVSLKSIRQLI